MFAFLRNLSMSTKTSLMALLGYMFFGLAVTLIAFMTLQTYLMEQAQERVHTNAGLARALLERAYGKSYTMKGNTLYVGTQDLNDNNDIIEENVRLIGGGVMTIFMGDTRVATNVVDPQTGKRAVGTKLAKNAAYESVFTQKKFFLGEAKILGEDYLTAYDPILSNKDEVLGIIFVGIKKSEQLQLIDMIVEQIGIATLGLGLLMSVFTYFAIRRQMKPLVQLENVMSRLREEDTTAEVPALNRNDEIGRMAKAVEIFRESIIEKMALRQDQALQKQRAEEERRAMMNRMADDFERSVRGIVETVAQASSEMQGSARSMNAIADNTTQQSSTVAQAAAQAADNIQMIVEASGALTEAIKSINVQIEESTTVAASCVTEAENTSASMQNLSHAAEDIDNVVKLIEGIANQVNLLALNATIEAARAGEAGKGFAVVANEVKNLANQARNATKDITQQISNIQEQTRQAVGTIGSITETIRRVNDISKSIALAVESQGLATHEISRSIMDTAESAQTVTSNIERVTHSASEVGTTSTQVLGTAERLAEESRHLREAVDGLIAHIRQS